MIVFPYDKQMSETDQIDKDVEALLSPLREGEATSAHDAWLRREIEKTLAKKQRDARNYGSLDDVMRKLGFNAR